MIIKLIDLDDCTHFFDNVERVMVINKEYPLPKNPEDFSKNPSGICFLNHNYYQETQAAGFYKYNELILYKDSRNDLSQALYYDPACGVWLLNNQGKTIERI